MFVDRMVNLITAPIAEFFLLPLLIRINMGSACTHMDDDHVVVGPVDATTLPSPHHTSIVPSPTLHTADPAANDPTRLIHLKQVVRKKTANAQFHSIPVSQDEPRTTTPTTTFVPQLPLWPPPRRDPSPNPSPTISLCSNQPVLHLFGARLMHPTGAPFEVLGTTTFRPSDPPLMSSGSSPQRVESLTTMTTSSSRTPRKQSCSARTVRSSFQGPNASDAFSSVYEL